VVCHTDASDGALNLIMGDFNTDHRDASVLDIDASASLTLNGAYHYKQSYRMIELEGVP